MTDLYFLVYASTAVRDYSEAELLELLTSARRFNGSNGVTGLLLYAAAQGSEKGTFVQVLEGARDVITRLYQTITKDPRHEHCTVMKEGSLFQRRFPDWTMGFRNLSGLTPVQIPGFNTIFSTARGLREILTEPDPVLQLMYLFAQS